MTGKSGSATAAVAEHFAGLERQVGFRLGSMVAHGKTTLADFANFTQDILGQILGSVIGAGINAGIGTLLPSPAPAAAGGGGATIQAQVAHQGGIVGAPGSPTRKVSLAEFAGAPRYHRGGTVGANEVPIIALRGERVVPAGEAVGGGVTVQVIDQRSGGAPVETRQRGGPGGERQVQLLIRDEVSRQIARGEHDTAFQARFGARPALGTR